MRPSDIEAVADLLGEAADATGGVAQETHAAIARRAFEAAGAWGRPAQVIHDGIAGAVYAGVRAGLRSGVRQAGRAVALRMPDDAPALGTRTGEAVALGALQGFAGDLLERRDSPLATPLGLWLDGQPVAPTAEALAAAYPEPTRRLAVFIHGLCETELAWRGVPRTARRRPPRTLPRPAARRRRRHATPDPLQLGPTHLRQRSRPRRPARRGDRALAGAAERHRPHRPLDGRTDRAQHRLAGPRRTVGEARRTRRLPRHAPPRRRPRTRRHLLDWALGQTPETRAFSKALRLRSAGIKDLRFGSASEEDWTGQDPDELMRRRAAEVPFLPYADYCWISASLTRGPVGHLLGDLLVRTPSASGSGRGHHVPFEIENGTVLHGLTHFDLLDHPAVYEQIVTWFTRPARLPVRT